MVGFDAVAGAAAASSRSSPTRTAATGAGTPHPPTAREKKTPHPPQGQAPAAPSHHAPAPRPGGFHRPHGRRTRRLRLAALVPDTAPRPPDGRPRLERLRPPGLQHRGRHLLALALHVPVGCHRIARPADRRRRAGRGRRARQPASTVSERSSTLDHACSTCRAPAPADGSPSTAQASRARPHPVAGRFPQHPRVALPRPRARRLLLQPAHPSLSSDDLGCCPPQRLLARLHAHDRGTVTAHLITDAQQSERTARQALRIPAMAPPPRRLGGNVPLPAAPHAPVRHVGQGPKADRQDQVSVLDGAVDGAAGVGLDDQAGSCDVA